MLVANSLQSQPNGEARRDRPCQTERRRFDGDQGMDVTGKVVAITGAARGLGQEFAASLAAAGARIVVGDLNDCADTLDRVKQAGPEGVGVKLNVTDAGSAWAMIETGVQAFG